MATGLPDNEAVNEEEQTNELDQLNNTMSSVKDVLLAQLESLKSIARWQDQTALYTSHLQNIKVNMDQVRKWGEPISHIAQRVDVIADKLTADATPNPDETPKEDASSLGPALTEIAANTRMTYEAVEVLADATREAREDRREVQEPVKQDKGSVRDKKAETGIRKHMGDAMTGVKDFFSKILSWFTMAGLFIAPLMVGPDQLFGTLKEFFGHLKKFFTAITKFFLENVVPAISFLMDKLVGFFNELSGPLSRLGTEIGHALKLIGPKLWNAVSPVLDAVGVGLIKAIDFFTVVVGKIGPALDVIGQFVSDIFAKFGGAEEVVGNTFDKIGDFFEGIMNKMKATNVEDMMDGLRIGLQTMFNNLMDALFEISLTMIRMYVEFKDPGNVELYEQMVQDYALPLKEAKFDIDRSNIKAGMIDFTQSDAEIDEDIRKAEGRGDLTSTEAQTMRENKQYFAGRQAKRVDHSLGRIKNVIVDSSMGIGDASGQRVNIVEVSGLKSAIPGWPGPDVSYFAGYEDNEGGKVFYDQYFTKPEDVFTGGAPAEGYLSPEMVVLLESLVKRSQTAKGKSIMGKELDKFTKRPELENLTPVELQSEIITEANKLNPVTQPPGTGGGGGTTIGVASNSGGNRASSFSIHRSGNPTVEFGRRYAE